MSGAKLPRDAASALETEVRELVARREKARAEEMSAPWNERVESLDEEARRRALGFIESFIALLTEVPRDLRVPELLPSDRREFARYLIGRLSSEVVEIDWLRYARHALRIGCPELSIALAGSFAYRSEGAKSSRAAEVILEACAIIDGVDRKEADGYETPASFEVHLRFADSDSPRAGLDVFSVDASGHARPVSLNPATASYLARATWE